MFNKEEIIGIGCDHGGFELKDFLLKELTKQGYKLLNYGTNSNDSVDYTDFAHPLAEDISSGKLKIGILICGSGNGISMTANKHPNVRCALCWNKEIALLAKQHNNANIISLPGRFIDFELALDMVKSFLDAEFEGGRHQRRIDKINCK